MTTFPIMPTAIHPPAAAYSHGVLTNGPGQFLFISGQVGVDRDGNTPTSLAAQAELCWSNIVAVLAAAGMTPANLVKITNFLTQMDNGPELGEIRAAHIGDARPASTVISVTALARPEWLIEIEAIAFKEE